ncbi:hypothetical protein [Paenibacillus sp. JCM 10914]|uniref:hypothetical protein n=1 Tax=Paenibacillus sp. JCM 10914 TaxID=1236974 RepID=UPI0003CC7924|nr:hypothetical protein [Paenibacillus sp. JCM 10914]GAE08605.1 hypothetical protein JCM10914_4910 [Paenibacillus sp. JCM 10914]
MSTYATLLPVWNAIQSRFHETVRGLQAEELGLQLAGESASIGYMLRHNAEVEYMFAAWFFDLQMPEGFRFRRAGERLEALLHSRTWMS